MISDEIRDKISQLAKDILGSDCACYADAWPAQSCADAENEVSRRIRDFVLAILPDLTREAVEAGRAWQPIYTVPRDRYVLLCDKNAARWDGNMEVGKWFGDDKSGCFWSPGGPNGGLEIGGISGMGHYGDFTHWMDLPNDPSA